MPVAVAGVELAQEGDVVAADGGVEEVGEQGALARSDHAGVCEARDPGRARHPAVDALAVVGVVVGEEGDVAAADVGGPKRENGVLWPGAFWVVSARLV